MTHQGQSSSFANRNLDTILLNINDRFPRHFLDSIFPGGVEPGSITSQPSFKREIQEFLDRNAGLHEVPIGPYSVQVAKFSDLKEFGLLGTLTFCSIHLGKWKGAPVVIKKLKENCFQGYSQEQEDDLMEIFWREAVIMSKTEHPNVVKFLAVVPDGPQPKLTVLCEFMQHGCLRKYLAENPGKLDKSDKVRIAKHAARGLAYLHAQNIIHFDVKCTNLLINLYDNNPCKIGDLGMFNTNISRTPEDLELADWKQSFPWIAPERLDDSGSRASRRAADIFSFGLVLWEIWTEKVPYANMDISLEEFLDDLKKKELRPAIPECCDNQWRTLMEDCWAENPMVRPSFADIVKRLEVM